MTDEDDESESPGWDAIDQALFPIYGEREPYHVGTVVPYSLGGPDPIHGISSYKNLTPVPHWHIVTYGFSELWAKESEDPELSGYGFELTFRPACDPSEETPPNWALNFLQNLGRYVFSTGNCFGPGHTLPLNGPIRAGDSTKIHAATFTHDPQLPPIDTPNGQVEFLQIVGLTMDELEAISSWDATAFLELRARHEPLLITDLQRESWLEDAGFAGDVARRAAEEGSSCNWLAIVMTCDAKSRPAAVRVQSIAIDGMKRRLLSRLPYDRDLVLRHKDASVVFLPATTSKWEVDEDGLVISLCDKDLTQWVNTLRPRAGHYPIPGLQGLSFEVLRTEIKDRDGKVVDVVG